MSPQNNLKTALAPLQQRWNALAQREQNLVLLAGSVVLLALVWLFAVAPALHSLRTAPARQAAAESQLQTMLQMQAQAELLRQQPQGNQADIRNLLEQSVKNELAASAQLQWLGNRAQVTLTNTPAFFSLAAKSAAFTPMRETSKITILVCTVDKSMAKPAEATASANLAAFA